MTKTEIIATLITIRDDLYLTKCNLQLNCGEHFIIKSCVAEKLVDKINNISNATKKDIVALIKREYIKAYSKHYFTFDTTEENKVIYMFMKQLVTLLNIKI